MIRDSGCMETEFMYKNVQNVGLHSNQRRSSGNIDTEFKRRIYVQNVGLYSNQRRGSGCMKTEFIDEDLHTLSGICCLIFLVTTFHCRYCRKSFKPKEVFWKHGYRVHKTTMKQMSNIVKFTLKITKIFVNFREYILHLGGGNIQCS